LTSNFIKNIIFNVSNIVLLTILYLQSSLVNQGSISQNFLKTCKMMWRH